MKTSSSNNGGSIGFLSDEKRLNVAVTRAKFSLYIVGNLDTLKVGNMYSNTFLFIPKFQLESKMAKLHRIRKISLQVNTMWRSLLEDATERGVVENVKSTDSHLNRLAQCISKINI